MNLFFIRHAQSMNNLLWDQTQTNDFRDEDPVLSPTGKKQVTLLVDHLANPASTSGGGDRYGYQLTHLYCSLMVRSIQTAQPIADRLGLSLAGLDMICEVGGIHLLNPETGVDEGLPGKPRSFFENNYPRLLLPEYVDERGWWNRPYETRVEGLQRAQRFLGWLLEKHGNTEDRVAIISHGDFFVRLMMALMQTQQTSGIWFLMNNTGITRFYFGDDEVSIMYQNRCEHLPPELIT